jgi:hypothetical protein
MRDALHSVVERVAEPGDAAAYAIVLGAFAQILPSIATILSIVWLCLRIWESDTVRGLRGQTPKPKTGAEE